MSAKVLYGVVLACALILPEFVPSATAGGGRAAVTCCEKRLDCRPRGSPCCRRARRPDCGAGAWACCRQPLYYRSCTAGPADEKTAAPRGSGRPDVLVALNQT